MASIIFEKVRLAKNINTEFCIDDLFSVSGQLILSQTKDFAIDILALKDKEGGVCFILYFYLVKRNNVISKAVRALSMQNLKALAKAFSKESTLKILLENVGIQDA